ncbi:TIGR02453 family protein [Lysobacter helvus]|uniref:TIGR02453 family protein n=2 Tax=Lysobacteraceae TaxID=32033 RepID=A0ABN6FXA5_9GAMM|nr:MULTISPECIES: DUF2461 domain-containing protein [Lysobacter]BCT93985.1 TIGR02453 family protein [Lysobacter caseinilyticus]BCT97141.1 TIGR02453 family protein [Lysobacter helvus]
MSTYFTEATFKFLRGLARNNERPWFLAHKAQYDTHVRAPFQKLLQDLEPALAEVSLQYRVDPRPVGGSLYRIQRDTRFANDKTPYKTWQGARLTHARGRQVEAPLFYMHLQPGNCFVGAGLWHSPTPIQRQVRQFIVDNPGGWQQAAHAPAFEKRFSLDDDDMLVRMPKGYPEDFPYRDDLRRRNFVALRPLDDATMLGPRLRQTLSADLAALGPFVDYLCAALDLEF